MTAIEDIEKAVANLPPDELARFRRWFQEFDTAQFDARVERDANSGKLDRLAEEAPADMQAGRTRELRAAYCGFGSARMPTTTV